MIKKIKKTSYSKYGKKLDNFLLKIKKKSNYSIKLKVGKTAKNLKKKRNYNSIYNENNEINKDIFDFNFKNELSKYTKKKKSLMGAQYMIDFKKQLNRSSNLIYKLNDWNYDLENFNINKSFNFNHYLKRKPILNPYYKTNYVYESKNNCKYVKIKTIKYNKKKINYDLRKKEIIKNYNSQDKKLKTPNFVNMVYRFNTKKPNKLLDFNSPKSYLISANKVNFKLNIGRDKDFCKMLKKSYENNNLFSINKNKEKILKSIDISNNHYLNLFN